jgi:protoheme IX farnesyltransferase
LLVPLGLAPCFIGMASWVYGSVAVVLGAVFLVFALCVWRNHGDKYAKRTFAFSIFYLFLLFAMLLVDRVAGFSA